MTAKELGDMPAYPVVINENNQMNWLGLTKLEAFTMAAMQGMWAGSSLKLDPTPLDKHTAVEIARDAAIQARACLAELAKEV